MRIESSIERFPGHVDLPDFLNVGQVRAFEDGFFGDPNEIDGDDKVVFLSVKDERVLPVLFKIVLEWHLEGIPEKPTLETFPMTPRADAHALVQWVAGEVYKIWRGEQEIPNA